MDPTKHHSIYNWSLTQGSLADGKSELKKLVDLDAILVDPTNSTGNVYDCSVHLACTSVV